MTVRFHSDNLGTETGFLAKWEEVAGETRYYNDNTISVFYVLCMFKMFSFLASTAINTTHSNFIASPNYPDNYFNEESKVH